MKAIIILMASTMLLHSALNDKERHAIAGTLIYGVCVIGGGALKEFDITDYFNGKTCLIPVAVAGIGKEIYDSQHDGHTADAMDAIATMAVPAVLSFTLYKW